jgi:hypothetical protein
MFYAAINTYATELDTGFANTWGVLAFETRAARDEYVKGATDLATRSITKDDIKHYVRAVRPFTCERYIIAHTPQTIDGSGPSGLIGEVTVGCENDAGRIRDLND